MFEGDAEVKHPISLFLTSACHVVIAHHVVIAYHVVIACFIVILRIH